jgi:hypothetical protein
MGTNFYRIPTEAELEERKARLIKQATELDISASAVNMGFTYDNPNGWDRYNPWDFFTEDVYIHLGKRSGGWKFCWNFHKDKYYQDKASLEAFVRSGRVVDEYGTEMTADEFLEMAYNWCTDGWDTQTYYEERPQDRISWMDYSKHHDTYVDGLRVSSSVEFS